MQKQSKRQGQLLLEQTKLLVQAKLLGQTKFERERDTKAGLQKNFDVQGQVLMHTKADVQGQTLWM